MVFVDLWNIVCQNYDTTGSNCHFCSYETLFAKIRTKQDQNVIFGGNIAKADVREPSNPAELANIVDKYLTNIFGSRKNSSKTNNLHSWVDKYHIWPAGERGNSNKKCESTQWSRLPKLGEVRMIDKE